MRVSSETERSVAGYFWKGSGRIVYLKDFKGDENFHLVSVDADGTNLVDLTPFDNVRAMVIDDRPDHDDEMLISLNKRNPEVFDVYRLNLKTKELTLIAENPGHITNWIPDHDGRIRVATSTDGVNTSLLYRADEKSPFKTVITTNFKETISPQFFSFDNTKLYASSNINRDKLAIVLIDPATAAEERVIFEHPDVDVGYLARSRKRQVITYAGFTTWKRQRAYFDLRIEAIFRDLERQLPGYEIQLQDHDDNESVYVISTSNDRTTGSDYLYDVATKELTKLADRSALARREGPRRDEADHLQHARRPHHQRLSHAPARRRARTCRSWSIRTAGRGRATIGATIPRSSSWRTAATPSCR